METCIFLQTHLNKWSQFTLPNRDWANMKAHFREAYNSLLIFGPGTGVPGTIANAQELNNDKEDSINTMTLWAEVQVIRQTAAINTVMISTVDAAHSTHSTVNAATSAISSLGTSSTPYSGVHGHPSFGNPSPRLLSAFHCTPTSAAAEAGTGTRTPRPGWTWLREITLIIGILPAASSTRRAIPPRKPGGGQATVSKNKYYNNLDICISCWFDLAS
jgi:hypothetical protein